MAYITVEKKTERVLPELLSRFSPPSLEYKTHNHNGEKSIDKGGGR